jgi:hypothetical protein
MRARPATEGSTPATHQRRSAPIFKPLSGSRSSRHRRVAQPRCASSGLSSLGSIKGDHGGPPMTIRTGRLSGSSVPVVVISCWISRFVMATRAQIDVLRRALPGAPASRELWEISRVPRDSTGAGESDRCGMPFGELFNISPWHPGCVEARMAAYWSQANGGRVSGAIEVHSGWDL